MPYNHGLAQFDLAAGAWCLLIATCTNARLTAAQIVDGILSGSRTLTRVAFTVHKIAGQQMGEGLLAGLAGQ